MPVAAEELLPSHDTIAVPQALKQCYLGGVIHGVSIPIGSPIAILYEVALLFCPSLFGWQWIRQNDDGQNKGEAAAMAAAPSRTGER
jgi:hypothetical protein